MARYKNVFYAIGFLAVVLLVWLGLSVLPQPNVVRLSGSVGAYDLRNSDFTQDVFMLSGDWESYPEKLSTPEDLQREKSESSVPSTSIDDTEVQYATHVMTLNLPKDEVYGMFMRTADYSMRLYVNGEQLDQVGVPGTTRESTTPRVIERMYVFTPTTDTTTIVMQAANFVHKEGANPPRVYIGGYEAVEQLDIKNMLIASVSLGCLLTATLCHLGMFILDRKRKNSLIFAACCLVFFLLPGPIFAALFPAIDWFIVFRIEYLLFYACFAVTLFFLDNLLPKLLNKYITRAYYAIVGIFAVLTIVLDPTIFTQMKVVFEIISGLAVLYLLVMLVLNLRTRRLQDFLALIGIVGISLFAVNDMLVSFNISFLGAFNRLTFTAPMGMVFLVFCYTLVLSLDNADMQQAMRVAQAHEQQLATQNASLDRMNQLKSELMDTISHEARTPLAVLSSYAELVSRELRSKGVNEQTATDLDTIILEAKRVARLIDSMKNMTMGTEEASQRVALDLGILVTQTAELYRHILEREGVELTLCVGDELPLVQGNPAELTQVLFNLLQNAKNNTPSGSITITVSSDAETVGVTVADTGTGIPPELLTRVFERGVHGENGDSGLGLAISKEIIDAHNGTLEITSELGKGTIAAFFLFSDKSD